MRTLHKFGNGFALFVIAALLAIAIAGAAPAVVGPTASAAATIWYVKPLGLDTNSCKTPALACKTISGALAKALPGDTIRVALGTYTASTGTEVVLVNKTVNLLGGWDTAFTSQVGRSVIDGQNVRGGIRKALATASLTVGRFKIKNGHATLSAGGGISSQGPLTVSNSILDANSPAGIAGGNGNLTVNNTTISNSADGGLRWNGSFAVTINNSTLDHNTTEGLLFNGASGSVTVNGSTISDSVGDGLKITGTLNLNNSTVSGTTLGTTLLGVGVSVAGTMNLNNATVTDNLLGVELTSGTATLTNSIVADNSNDGGTTPNDCAGTIGSGGYNVIGSADSCTFTSGTGDQVGTNASPKDALLGPLQINGGTTATHELLVGSPAIGGGNPATPGSGSGACLATDQRGRSRTLAAAGTCDSGAFETFPLGVLSITKLDASPTAAGALHFSVLFSQSVTGVDTSDFTLTTDGTIAGATVSAVTAVSGLSDTYTVTVNSGTGEGNIRLDLTADGSIKDPSNNPVITSFTSGDSYALATPHVVSANRVGTDPTSTQTLSYKVIFSLPVVGVDATDFGLPVVGLTGATVTSVTGSGTTYWVAVNHGNGSGTLGLNVKDNDSITGPSAGRPLGGPGTGNGFFVGQVYTIVPMPITPNSTSWDNTPTFTWAKLTGVTQYQIQVLRGTTVVYSPIIPATACGATTCSSTPATVLIPASYTWKVRAYGSAVWSPTKAFGVYGPQAGYWDNLSSWVSFYVNPSSTQILKFTEYIYVPGCGMYAAPVNSTPVPIVNGRFSFTGVLSATGTFATGVGSTTASGTAALTKWPLSGCGLVSVPLSSWNNYWQDSSQPFAGAAMEQNMMVLRMPDAPFGRYMPAVVSP